VKKLEFEGEEIDKKLESEMERRFFFFITLQPRVE